PRQLDLSSETCGGVARIHGPVSIGEVIALAGGAAFGIGLANDDWNAGELRVGRDHREAIVDRPKLLSNPHADVAVDVPRRALRVERDEVEGRARLARRVIRSAKAMLDEIARETAAASRGVGAADAGLRNRAANGRHGVVVELQELLARALPVADVRLVPGLPPPGLDLLLAVALRAVLRPLVDEIAPARVVLRRIGPTGVDLLVARARLPGMLVWLRLRREILRHEADLDVGPHAVLEIGIEDAIDDREVVDR